MTKAGAGLFGDLGEQYKAREECPRSGEQRARAPMT